MFIFNQQKFALNFLSTNAGSTPRKSLLLPQNLIKRYFNFQVKEILTQLYLYLDVVLLLSMYLQTCFHILATARFNFQSFAVFAFKSIFYTLLTLILVQLSSLKLPKTGNVSPCSQFLIKCFYQIQKFRDKLTVLGYK